MADFYVCPADGRGYNDVSRFLGHATTVHGHRTDADDCVCVCCHPEWIQPALKPKEASDG